MSAESARSRRRELQKQFRQKRSIMVRLRLNPALRADTNSTTASVPGYYEFKRAKLSNVIWRRTGALAAVSMMAIFAPPSALAQSPDSGVNGVTAANQDSSLELDRANNGLDITRPQNAIETRLSGQTSSSGTSETRRAVGLLRMNSKISLGAGWLAGILAEVPLVKETTATNAPSLHLDHEFGLGDTTVQLALTHELNERWAFAVGTRAVAPTSDDGLGSGKWQAMPGIGVRYMLPEWGPDSYFVPAVRYAISVAGDPSRRKISEPQIAPTLNIDLPGRWFITLYPSNDIRINQLPPLDGAK
jgi:hypothetical protein